MSNTQSDLAKRILEARFGPSPTTTAGEEFIVISAIAAQGEQVLALFEKQIGALEGRVAGMFRPCRMERVEAGIRMFLFSVPTEIVPRARLRVAQGYVAQGFGYVITNADPREFRWIGEEAEGKQSRGIGMDAYAPPQLNAEWIDVLITKPVIEIPKPSKAAASVASLQPAATSARVATPAIPKSQDRPFAKSPKAFSLRAEGAAGKRSLAQLEKRFGKLPAQLKIGGEKTQSFVFPVLPEAVAAAFAAQGEIAPGLFLEPERVFTPHAGFARAATAWLDSALKAGKP
jgi:hypothetical protein